MKKVVCIILIFLCVFNINIFSYAGEDKKDSNWQMWHGNQDALILGTIVEIDAESFSINVEKRLYPQGIIDDTYRQIPKEDIGEILEIEKFEKYETSYNEKKTPGVGDIIIVSLDKGGEIWKVNWPPFEVSGKDYQNLEFVTPSRETPESFAWLTFVKTDGKMNDFTFISEENVKKVIGRGIFNDGEIIEDEIYSITDKQPITIKVSFIKRNLTEISLGGILILIGGTIYFFYRKKYQRTGS